MKRLVLFSLLLISLQSCFAHIPAGKKIIKGQCNDLCFYESDGERLYLDLQSDSILGKWILSGDIDFDKVIAGGHCRGCLDFNQFLADTFSQKYYCYPAKKFVVLEGIESIWTTANEPIITTYELRFTCCNKGSLIFVYNFRLFKDKRGKLKRATLEYSYDEL